jgi:5-methylcytosine-specific restriction endonuclease McrA
MLLRDQKRPRILGHEAIHLVLLMDSLLEDYTRSWEAVFAAAFDHFREQLANAKLTRNDPNPSEYWLRYGVLTRVSSDRGETIMRRHQFFTLKMHEILQPQLKDAKRLFGPLEREIIYYRDKKSCAVCHAEVIWSEGEIHHVDEHAKGGATEIENGVLVHRQCHPKGAAATEFARRRQLSAKEPE